ncbi:hypothetical protein SDC9_67609 [bioreactor metagenome]|uniref:Glycosyltransferase 2-like domain-containing protein n=1 Tax=bioreactor metagenome TaxID=1076179 RepID=A0A644XY30_9ZZZZ
MNAESKKVSLIMPCYNCAEHLDVMLASVYGQTYDNLELICVNDGSTDGTRKKLEAWKPLLQARGIQVVLENKGNGGAASAINCGLGLFAGDYVCFPDSDDMLMPTYASDMAQYLDTHPEKGYVQCDWLMCEGGGANVPFRWRRSHDDLHAGEHLLESLIVDRAAHLVWAFMVRRTYLEQWLPGLRIYDGWQVQEFPLLLPLACGGMYGHVAKPLYFYFQRAGGFYSRHFLGGYAGAVEYGRRLHRETLCVIDGLPVDDARKARLRLLSGLQLLRNGLMLSRRYENEADRSSWLRDLADKIQTLSPSGYRPGEEELSLLYEEWLDVLISHLCTGTVRPPACPETPQEPIAIYGAGREGKKIISLLLAQDVTISHIWDQAAVDSDLGRYGGVAVSPPEFDRVSSAEKQRLSVLVTIMNSDTSQTVCDRLRGCGFAHVYGHRQIRAYITASIVPRFLAGGADRKGCTQ